MEGGGQLTHDDAASNYQLAIVVLEDRESPVDNRRSRSNTDAIAESFQTDLNWIRSIDGGEGEWKD